MTLLLRDPGFLGRVGTSSGYVVQDPDAAAWVAGIEAGDGGQALEDGVREAYDVMVQGLKTDGLFNSFVLFVIIGGARTINGAMVPLFGPSQTAVAFTPSDYDRKEGLTGNGTSKYIETGIVPSTDISQNDAHYSGYPTTTPPATDGNAVISSSGNGTPVYLHFGANSTHFCSVHRTSNLSIRSGGYYTGFFGSRRSSSGTEYLYRNGSQTSYSASSGAQTTRELYAMARNDNGALDNVLDARQFAYTAGSNLDLALLEARMDTFKADIAAAIP